MCCNVEIKGKELKVSDEKESWGTAYIMDGKNKKKVQYRVALIGAKKLKDGTYAFRSTVLFNHEGQHTIKPLKRAR